jgi:hypothetical protein
MYDGCDRSVPGNGFPRKFNYFDHMRRVHGHVEQTGKKSRAGQRAEQSSVRKKKATASRSSGSVVNRRRAAPAPSPLQQSQIVQQQPAYNGQPTVQPDIPQVHIQGQWMPYSGWPNPRG